jgi:hypothetical protein
MGLEDCILYEMEIFVEEKDCMEVPGINGIMPRRSCLDNVGLDLV